MKKDVALVFVTIDRPDAAQRLVFSIRERFPDLPIHVADQTEPSALMRAFYARHGVNALWMPHDSGVSACRNALVAATDSEFLFLCDDDLIFTPETEYSGALQILERDPEVGIVGGRWIDRYPDGGENVRQWALFLLLDEKNQTLTGVPAYHYLPNARHVGVHKYFLSDTALNFALFRRSVFDDPAVRWDPRFQCNGEHEDFYLNLKTASRYRVAYFPGLVCVHSRPRATTYERLRERAEGWRRFMEKWRIKQYCELDHGTRTFVEPDKVHGKRTWRDYLSGFGLTSEQEVRNDAYEVSLTDDWQVILANHYDPETGAKLSRRRSKSRLFLNGEGRLLSAGDDAELLPSADDLRADAVAKLRAHQRDVDLRFQVPIEAHAGGEVLALVQIENRGTQVLPIGQNSPAMARFVSSYRKDGAIVLPWDESTPCFADLSPGVHEQLLGVPVPETPGVYELRLALVGPDGCLLGEPCASRLEVTSRRARAHLPSLDTPRVESGRLGGDGMDREPPDAAPRLQFVREQVRMEPIRGAAATRSLLPVLVECRAEEDGARSSVDLLVTCHFKKDGRYVAFDVERSTLAGVRAGKSVRALSIARAVDPTVDVEVAVVVIGAGYVPLFELRNARTRYAMSSSSSVSVGK